jgi:predicted RNA-binding protein Jag
MNKEQTIQHYMKKLGIDHDEAEQMWLDEQEDNLPELTEEQKAVEKEMMRADRKKETEPRKRERKADEDKRFLINKINDALHLYACASVVNPEREIEIIYKGNRYRLTLAKPRK